MSDDEKYKAEFDLFWNDLEKLEGHQRSPSNKNARKAYVAGRKHTEAEIENLRLVKSSQSDIIDNKSSKIKDRDQRIAELEAENQEVKRWLNVSRMLNGELRALVEEIQDRFETCNYISGFFFEWEQKVTAILNNDKEDEV